MSCRTRWVTTTTSTSAWFDRPEKRRAKGGGQNNRRKSLCRKSEGFGSPLQGLLGSMAVRGRTPLEKTERGACRHHCGRMTSIYFRRSPFGAPFWAKFWFL